MVLKNGINASCNKFRASLSQENEIHGSALVGGEALSQSHPVIQLHSFSAKCIQLLQARFEKTMAIITDNNE